MTIERQGQKFGDSLLEAILATGAHSQLTDPGEAFQSGCYFGAVQGYKRGVNVMLKQAIDYLPVIFNQIAETNFDMNINWKERFKELLLTELFKIDEIQEIDQP